MVSRIGQRWVPLVDLNQNLQHGRLHRWAVLLMRGFVSLVLLARSVAQHIRRIRSEVRSLCGHIETRNAPNFLVGLGPGFQMSPNGHLEPYRRTRARIRDIQSMVSSRPWASPVDLQICLEGWDKGAECVASDVRNSDCCSTQLGTDT